MAIYAAITKARYEGWERIPTHEDTLRSCHSTTHHTHTRQSCSIAEHEHVTKSDAPNRLYIVPWVALENTSEVN